MNTLSVKELNLVSSLSSIATQIWTEEICFNEYKNATSIKNEEEAKSHLINLADNYYSKIKELETTFNEIFSKVLSNS